MSETRIKELAEIEFEGSLGECFGEYSKALQHLGRRLVFELEMASNDSRAAMSRLHGHPLLFGISAKVRARMVARRLKRAQEMAAALVSEGRAFEREYRRQFLSERGL